ncbi:MAG: orotate phosphoribosyltransferase [Planctomycetia bacterium]|nr:orotate phosphoribosyltransferase [Planctomycetia bacterium]
MYDKETLKALVREKALKFGDFTLASGKKSTYYLDGKQITLDSAGAKLVAEGILELLVGGAHPTLPDAVGGMSIGADPITAAVVTMAGVQGRALRGFMVRKESKGHGTNRFIEGPVRPGDEVVILEDVVTTGGSSILAIERCREFGLVVRGVICIIDRLQGGAEEFGKMGLSFQSLLSIRDFGIEPPAT